MPTGRVLAHVAHRKTKKACEVRHRGSASGGTISRQINSILVFGRFLPPTTQAFSACRGQSPMEESAYD